MQKLLKGQFNMARELVTSENREEFMEKKMAKMKKSPKDEQAERAKKSPKYQKLRMVMGSKGAIDVILKEMNDAQRGIPAKEEK